MGTQQVLMIVLGVIIVGIAVAVGIYMFGGQAFNSNRAALISEMNYFATLAIQYWRLPASLGGASMNPANLNLDFLASYMGFSTEDSKVVAQSVFKYFSDNGEYRVQLDDTSVVFTGLGKEEKDGVHPFVTLSVELTTGAITTEISTAEGFE
ncbi:MAG: hypothetical protein U1C33_05400 [Candidatus Cloacimonadaceae bacterium]|nr:hypothetical protein [Candidatus Cloacimonadaceae bacterium]